jgi:two-component system sensor histidine kinase UhpB
MHLLQLLHNRTSLFVKVLVANALIVVVGSMLAVAMVTRLWQQGERLSLQAEGVIIMIGLVISLGVNWVILRLAFRPLFTLQETLDRVRRGDYSARVPMVQGDPDIARVTETANLMLDRLAEHRQALAAQILRALEEERKRIARELHDETSQSLTSLLVNLEAVEQQLLDDPAEARSRLTITKDITRRSLDETRRLMFDLRPSVLDDLGLVPALRWLISHRVHPVGLQAEFLSNGFDERLSEELETALFRILQEAINNTVKHAKASMVRIELTRVPGQIVGLVQDDGIGFYPIEPGPKDVKDRGLGLFGMHERAGLVGGKIEIISAPGRGTVVRVVVPDRTRGKGQSE